MARKYFNRPTDVDGYHFDSESEARRYAELCMRLLAGDICELTVHPEYELQARLPYKDWQTGKRRTLARIVYEGDFSYIEGGRIVCEDVKGMNRRTGKFMTTAVFDLKRKLFMARYPHIELRLVSA